MVKESFTMKNIISIGYYSDFSRFFNIIKNGLNEIVDCNWVNFSIYPSGYLYDFVHNNKRVFLNRAIVNSDFYDIDKKSLDWICEYHDESSKLRKEALKYLSYYDGYLKNNAVDLIILSGDSRMPIRAMMYIAKIYKIKVIFFEQGPLNTTILDSDGVNANCSFRHNDKVSYNVEPYLEAKNIKVKKWNGYKKYRIIDLVYQFLSSTALSNSYKLAKQPKIEIDLNKVSNKKTILLILQVPEDANMICHSPYFSDHLSIVSQVFKAIPQDYQLIIREHPLYIGKYEKELYKYIALNQIKIDSKTNLKEAIDLAELVIVNNSTVGLEAITQQKKILVLGDSYYDNPLFVNKYNGVDLQSHIEKALTSNDLTIRALNRIYYLFECEFIQGHFRDFEINRFKYITKKVLNEIK